MQPSALNCLPSAGKDLPRLNPFAFPRDTDFRLIILIVSVTGASLFIYGNLYYSISGIDRFFPLHCALWMLGGSLLVTIVAGGIYWFKPEWEIRRCDWQILEDEDVPAPGITAYLTNLCKEVRLEDHLPIFLWHPMTDDGGQAFGRIGRVYIYLSGALVRSFKHENERPAFRANVLHELAHIYNSDVHRTSLSIAVWYAFVIAALPAFAIALLNSPLERIVNMSWRTLLLFLLIYLTWCAILRVREFYADVYADVQASRFDGFSNTLRAVIERNQVQPRTIIGSEKANYWQQFGLKIWHRAALHHPTSKERSQILEDPTPLMYMGFWDAFATGMATTNAFFNLSALVVFWLLSSEFPASLSRVILSNELPDIWDRLGILIFLLPAVIFGLVVIYILGVGIWRMTLAEIVLGKPIHGIDKLAIGFACGTIMGLQTSFIAATRYAPPLIAVLSIGLLWLFILAIFFRWIALGASTWLPVAIVSSSPRSFYRWGLAASGVVLVGLLVNLPLAWVGLAAGTSIHNTMAASSLTTLVLVCLWGFPLAACFWRRKVGQANQVSSWLFLDDIPQPINLPFQPNLKLGLALTIGLAIGSAGSLILAILLPGAQFLGLGSFSFLLAGSICIQVIAAALATIYVRDLSHLHGLFGTFIAGCVLAIGVVGIMLAAGGLVLADVPFVILMIVNNGGIFALPTVLIISTLARFLRRTILRKA